MTKANPPHIPNSEPTEAAVCRLMLATYKQRLNVAIRGTEADAWRKRVNALRACMKAAGWDTGEEPQEEQTILDAG